jgi:hypothetical protein
LLPVGEHNVLAAIGLIARSKLQFGHTSAVHDFLRFAHTIDPFAFSRHGASGRFLPLAKELLSILPFE